MKTGGRETFTVDGASSIFYADKGVVASTNLLWLQTASDMLTGLFDRLGLQKKFRKTVGMVFHPCQALGVQADEAYKS